MKLIIAEKPSLGRTIANALGKKRQDEGFIELNNGDCVTWLAGHFYEFAEPDAYLVSSIKDKDGKKRWREEDLPIIPTQWVRVLKSDSWVKKQHKVALGLLKKASLIVNAGDPDREGQLLIDEWLEENGNRKPVLRVWLKDLTEEGIRKAFNELVDNAKMRPLYESALARAKADWLIGMNATRAMTLAQGGKLLSIGRVQTPTLALIVERDKAIESFVPRDYFEVFVTFAKDNASWKGKWIIPESLLDAQLGLLIDKTQAQACIDRVKSIGEGIVERVETKRKRVPPPLPFSLSDLQKHLSRFGFGAQETLNTVQKLYEEGVLTYPRTDCNYLESGKHQEAPKVFEQLAQSGFGALLEGADLTLKSRAFDDKKITAHTAIIPTTKPAKTIEGKAKTLYEEVVKRYVTQFFPPYEYDETTITTRVGEDRFLTVGRKVIVSGWKRLYQERQEEDEESVPELQAAIGEGDRGKVRETELAAKKTQPPKRFTEGTLIEAMSHAARFIQDERYRKVLRETDGIGTEATRASIIETLKARGFIEIKGKKKEIVSTPLGRQLIETVPKALADVALTAIWEQTLSLIAEGRYRAQDFERDQTVFIKDIISKIQGTRGTMSASGKKESTMEKVVLGTCPVCGEGEMTETQKGYSCSRWREGCKFTIWKEIAGRKIERSEAEELLREGRTSLLTGFKSKAGRYFSAHLVIDKDAQKVSFEFEPRT